MTDRLQDDRLGQTIKQLLREKSMSMRRLGALTGIDAATISRIASGKQTAKTEQLQKMAECLGVPVQLLLEASGLTVPPPEARTDFHLSVDAIQETLAGSNWFDERYTTQRVEQQLVHYENYARTEEGKRVIHEDFEGKLQQVDGMGPFIEHLKSMHATFCADGTTETERAIIGGALLYFILATDIIPDYVFPIGYLDDAIAVRLTLQKLAQIGPDEPDHSA